MAAQLKAVEPTTDNAAAPVGHNVSEESVIRVYVADMVALKAEQKALAEKIKARRKQLKADMGVVDVNLGELDQVIKMSSWTPDDVRESFDRRQRYASFLGLPIGTQGSLFDDPRVPEVEQQRAKWRARGFSDGVKGIGWPESPPKECHQDSAQAYGEGWQAGQAQLAEDRLAAPAGPAAPAGNA